MPVHRDRCFPPDLNLVPENDCTFGNPLIPAPRPLIFSVSRSCQQVLQCLGNSLPFFYMQLMRTLRWSMSPACTTFLEK